MDMYYNLICEEISFFGGKVIWLDENLSDLEKVHKMISENILEHPNAKWELYVMGATIK